LVSVLTRRSLLLAPLAPSIQREVFLRAPGKGTAVMAYACYTERRGGAMMSIEQRWSRSDTIDVAYVRRSNDHGRIWSEPKQVRTGERRAEGMLRRHLRVGWVEPRTGRFLEFRVEGVLPNDEPLEGMRQWAIRYRIGEGPDTALIAKGQSEANPLPGVWIGKNSFMLGDQTSRPLALPDGSFLLPTVIAPLKPDGTLANPGGGYTWHDAAILRAVWRGAALEWELIATVPGDPKKSTRGWDEPTLAVLRNGRILMVLRGSNDKQPVLPAHKWACWSEDGGRTWTSPQPWTYDDGKAFHSPSACSQLLAHPNGRLYWLGNITEQNPVGNRPRYPFVVGEVDLATGLLRRSTVRLVDDLQPGEDPLLTLSNFYAREDRQTGGIALHMTRLFALKDGWQGDAFLYRIPA
jgi:hypothetical protein